ncbi:MAG: aminopeptidase [Bacteroidales bacterium]|nr:aminopeptidase [Bacteroidales bacterium]
MKHNYLLLFLIMFSFSSCHDTYKGLDFEKGVSFELNNLRKEMISNPKYDLSFAIPEKKTDPIIGKLNLSFELKNTKHPVILDFQNPENYIQQVQVNHKAVQYDYKNEHIIIAPHDLSKGMNIVSIDFHAGNLSLNRNDDFLYTLFVPDRASTAFPCFDQPDLKAKFKLQLSIPDSWVAVANGALISKKKEGDHTLYNFKETQPLSTYLFAFVAGKFQHTTQTRDGKQLTFYYRETNKDKIQRNLDKIFELQGKALQWMEQYTGIPYPFGKFDFIAIPSFQYSGMEHPGAVLYRASRLFLDASATQTQELFRASLLSHETAHMWFGDLVTMKWFNDVWLKEVFANFMAAKMVNPAFPNINHQLLFLVDHYPKAYSIDLTAGANPVQQKLENLNMAGTLYGNIIYHKAPIVMRMLENIVGKDSLRSGLQTYLHRYAFGNANWDDLIGILDKHTSFPLQQWSQSWVKEAGMPHYQTKQIGNSIIINQSDPHKKNRLWMQRFHLLQSTKTGHKQTVFFQMKKNDTVRLKSEAPVNLLNGAGEAYGYFAISDAQKKLWLSNRIFSFSPLQRAAIYIDLWENMQDQTIKPSDLYQPMMHFIQEETVEQNVNLLLSYYTELFWRFSTASDREKLSGEMETLLWNKIHQASTVSLKASYYHAWIRTALGQHSIQKMIQLWEGKEKIKGLPLSEDDLTRLSYELAVRIGTPFGKGIPGDILQQQLKRITNPDKQKEMQFIMPALNENIGVRTEFFESLKKEENREHEPWVITAVSYLNHPLRARSALPFMLPALEMVPEIQASGDIFFPKSWLDATFSGHNSRQAAVIIHEFLEKNHDFNPKLMQKILQSTDPVLCAESMLYGK